MCVYPCVGGMAGFVLAWFHKLEKKKKSPYVCIKNRRNQQESEAKSNDIDLQDFSQVSQIKLHDLLIIAT